jgi:hypothetical protein
MAVRAIPATPVQPDPAPAHALGGAAAICSRARRAVDVIDHPGSPPICPRCQAVKPYRHGHAHGLQRYRCRVCSGTFNALSGTPLARLRHKARWLDYLDGMLESRIASPDAFLRAALGRFNI